MIYHFIWKNNKWNTRRIYISNSNRIKEYYSKCIEEQKGNQIIQQLIAKLKTEEQYELVNVVLDHVYDSFIHQYNWRVIQKLFDICNENVKYEIIIEINKYIIELCQYGDYVIQNVLETKQEKIVMKFIKL